MDGGRFRAGIELYGRTLRYAEVDLGAEGDEAPRLVRLGACDFDFDVEAALFDLTGPTHLATVAAAVREIFEGSKAAALSVVVHPWWGTSFFSPLPEGMSPAARYEQLRQEAALLSDASVSRPIRIRATPTRVEAGPEGPVHWHHVLRLPESVHARVAHLAEQLGADEKPRHEFADATAAAVAVAARVRGADDVDEEPLALALGLYEGRTEYALCRGATWLFGHYAETDALGDGAYFAAALLQRLGVDAEEVGHLFLYGDGAQRADGAGIGALLGLEAVPLNPLAVFGPARGRADAATLSTYAPCIGALLR